jgi:hypothetical protein
VTITSVEVAFVEELARRVPEFRPLLDAHIRFADEILAYVAVAEFAELFAYAVTGRTNVVVQEHVEASVVRDEGVIERCASALEAMATHEDERVSRDLLGAGFFEGIDDGQLRAVARRMGPAARTSLTRMPPDGYVP